MNDVYVIEQMIAVGYWELASRKFYTDERQVTNDCLSLIEFRRKTDKGFCARVTKLEIAK